MPASWSVRIPRPYQTGLSSACRVSIAPFAAAVADFGSAGFNGKHFRSPVCGYKCHRKDAKFLYFLRVLRVLAVPMHGFPEICLLPQQQQ